MSCTRGQSAVACRAPTRAWCATINEEGDNVSENYVMSKDSSQSLERARRCSTCPCVVSNEDLLEMVLMCRFDGWRGTLHNTLITRLLSQCMTHVMEGYSRPSQPSEELAT